jgi:dTDP-4-dehydrorhamnose 3,5-epimerase
MPDPVDAIQPPEPSLLEVTLAAAKRDRQMASSSGKLVGRLTHGVLVRDLTTLADERGTVTELYDPRWNFHPDPLVFAYCFTIRPGFVKGWNLHKEHEDRYVVLQGEMQVVFFDPRPDSPTYGEVAKVVTTGHRRQVVTVPKFVWHADHNIGSTDVVAVNFPTTPYQHENPDKYRLPIDTDLIPYAFPNLARGW